MSLLRTRWAAVGAAVAVAVGAGGIGLVSATKPSGATTFIAITPCRVVDTRPGPDLNVGPRSTPLGPGETHTVSATGNTGNCTEVPASAAGVSLNVTALGATLPTFLTVWATGAALPDASSLNPVPDAPPTPNAVTTELSADGGFSIYNLQGSVDVIADINGYYTDHDHDDRYYTKSQANNRFLGDGQAATAATAGEDAKFSLTDETTLLSATVATPTTGTVIANASVAMTSNAVTHSTARCSIGTAPENDTTAQVIGSVGDSIGGDFADTIAATRGFQIDVVPSGGTSTYYLVCDYVFGVPDLYDPQLTLIFVPDHDSD